MCGRNARPWFWVLKITVFDQRDFIWRSMLDQALAVSSVNGWESCVAELTKLKSIEEYPKAFALFLRSFKGYLINLFPSSVQDKVR